MQQVEAAHDIAQHDPVRLVAQFAVFGAGIDVRLPFTSITTGPRGVIFMSTPSRPSPVRLAACRA